VWQPKRHIGVGILREPGALCWTELITRDTNAAEKFYTQLFGWTAKRGTDAGMEYTELSNGGIPQAGLMALTPQMGNMPPAWTPYFAVTDCDATAKKAADLGGRVYVKPTDIPNVGRFAVLADPHGAVFDIIKLARA
jgi:predicted enzyme related to lactoylglutathione lyase